MTAASNSGKYVEFDEYVGLKLEKTQSTIRTTDLLTAMAGVAAMFLGYLLVFIVFDQWVVPGGFNVIWRWALLSTLMFSTIAWLVFKVGIPSFRNVNGLFAAQEIEKAEPELKSNLLNLIDLKEAGRKVNPQILKSMERQAAVRLQSIDVAQVIDHRPLVHAAYLLLAIIVVFCCYALLSPKKISNSIWRGLLPAAQVPLATVTEIIDVKPGDITIPAHQPLVNVQVDLAGEIPAQVWLLYTTADGKQDQPIELRAEQEGQPRYTGQILGEGTQGLTQDLSYFIRAGDATSRTYAITVEQPPYAEIESLRVEFPPYMKLLPIEQQKSGVIDAWEGAKVTLTAKTNMPVRSGVIQFIDDPAAAPTGEEVVMSTSRQGMQLQAAWTLALRSDGSYPRYYRIHCKTEDGRVTTGHVILPQTIRPDLPPEVVLLQPDRDLESPANATVPLLIQARDPDFELGYLYLNVEKAGQKILRDNISEGHQPKLTLKHDLELSTINPVVGDTLEFWIEVYDNKQPRPNSRNTPKVKIQIVAPVSTKEAEKQLADLKEQRDQKLTEAEQETNPDRRDPAQPADGDPQDHKRQETARSNEADPPQSENAKTDQPQEGQQGTAQQAKKQNPTGNQDQNQAQGQGQGSNASQNSRQGSQDQKHNNNSESPSGETVEQNKPLKNDGSQDDEAIRRINDRIKKNQSQKSSNSNDQASSDKPHTDTPDQGDKTQKEQPSGDSKKKDQAAKSGQDLSRNQPQEGSQPDQQTPAEKDKTEGHQPNGEPSDDREEGDRPSKKPDRKDPDKDDKNSADSKRASDAKNEKNPDPKTPMNNQGEKGEQERPKSSSEKEKSEQGNASDESQSNTKQGKPDASKSQSPSATKPGTQSQPQKGNDSKEQQSKNENGEQGQDDQTQSKPSKEGSSAESKKNSSKKEPSGKNEAGKPKTGQSDSDSKTNGPKEQVPDSPDAKKGTPDGTEEGTGKPDRDPNAKANPGKNDKVKRDPNEKPESRPGDSNPNQSKTPKEVQNETSKPDNDSGQPSGKEESPDMKNGDTAPANPKQGTNSDSEKTASDENTKRPTDGEKGKMPKESPESQTSDETGSKKQESTDGAKKQGGKPQAESKPDEEAGTDDKEGQDSKPGSGKSEKQKKAGASSEQGSPEKQKAPDKPMNDKASNEKASTEKGSSEKPQSDSDSKNDSAQEEKKGEGAPEKNSADQDQGGAKSEKGSKESGQSGKSDSEKGGSEESESKDGKGDQSGGQGDKGKPPSKMGSKSGTAGTGGAGSQGESIQTQGGHTAEPAQGEDANLEYNRQATELILQKLKKDLERGDADPELLKELGWTPDEMKRFADRISKSLNESKQSEESAEGKARQQQFQEMLKNLDLKSAGNRRSGENEPKREVNQIESRRSQPPAAYRSAFEKFTKDLARQKASSKDASSK